MSAIASITINDGKATPLSHVFNPTSTNPAAYRNGSSTYSANGLGFDETLGVDVKVNPDGISKVKLSMRIPHAASGGGTYSAVTDDDYYETVNVEFLFHTRASSVDRKDARVLLTNLLANAQIADAVDNLVQPY